MDQPTINNASPQGGNSPFQMPPNIAAPEPMGQKTSASNQQSNPYQNKPLSQLPDNNVQISAPPPSGPPKPVFSYVLMIILVIVLIAGILFFAAWKGWISFGGLFGGATPSPVATLSPKVSPAISSVLPNSPTTSSSPQTLANVNDSTRKKDLAKIKSALQDYFSSKSGYPPSANLLKTSDKASVLVQALVPTYLESLPDDPLAPPYYYGYKSDGKTFELTAALEDKSDSSGTLIGSYNIYKITDSSTE